MLELYWEPQGALERAALGCILAVRSFFTIPISHRKAQQSMNKDSSEKGKAFTSPLFLWLEWFALRQCVQVPLSSHTWHEVHRPLGLTLSSASPDLSRPLNENKTPQTNQEKENQPKAYLFFFSLVLLDSSMFCVYMTKIPQAEPVGKKLCGLGWASREVMRHCRSHWQ